MERREMMGTCEEYVERQINVTKLEGEDGEQKTVSVVRKCLNGKGRDVLSAPSIVWFGCFPVTSQENC